MGVDEFGADTTAVEEWVERFQRAGPEPHVWSAVYGISHAETGSVCPSVRRRG